MIIIIVIVLLLWDKNYDRYSSTIKGLVLEALTEIYPLIQQAKIPQNPSMKEFQRKLSSHVVFSLSGLQGRGLLIAFSVELNT